MKQRESSQRALRVKQELERMGYHVTVEPHLYSGVSADLAFEKDGVNYIVEIKASRTDALKMLNQVDRLRMLPDVGNVYVAAPSSLLTKDSNPRYDAGLRS